MNKPLKAALFSAFIFPGLGQVILKKYFSAAFYAAFAGVGLYLLFSDLLSRAQDILTKIESGEVSADLATITHLVQQQSEATMASLTPALTIFMISWLVSIVEAYRVGRKLVSEQSDSIDEH